MTETREVWVIEAAYRRPPQPHTGFPAMDSLIVATFTSAQPFSG